MLLKTGTSGGVDGEAGVSGGTTVEDGDYASAAGEGREGGVARRRVSDARGYGT